MTRALHAPALHFVLAGALLFTARSWWEPAADTRPRLVLTADDVDRVRDEWTARHGAAPDPAAEQALIDDAIDAAVLHRAALDAGLDRQDRLVRTRLENLERFLGEATERDRDDAAGDATGLGLVEHDVVIRRHLVQVMRLGLSRVGAADLPGDGELEAYLRAHAALFRQPERIRLSHVYLGRARHGAALDRDAARLLDALRRGLVTPASAPAHGDPFLRGAHPPAASGTGLDRVFGPGFAAAIADAPPGEWVGPVRSSYGLHLVWIHERLASSPPDLDDVRGQVAHRFLAERGRERLHARLAALRARYAITVER